MLTITRKFEFEAAHYLPNHLGKCRNLHGHSYKLVVTVDGEMCTDKKSPMYGMLIDFSELDRIVKKIIQHNDRDISTGLDHNILNNVFEYPTAEIMVSCLAVLIDKALNENGYETVFVRRVDLWETSDSYASWVRDK